MKYTYTNTLGGVIILTDEEEEDKKVFSDCTLYKLIWVMEGELKVVVDHIKMVLQKDELISLSSLHQIGIEKVNGKYISILFNSPFYSIYKHDEDVSCNGLLFNGSSHIIHLHLTAPISGLLQDVIDKMKCEHNSDDLEGEMLRLLLKRFIIICTRQARLEYPLLLEKENGLDVIRQYFVLVNNHFMKKKRVKDYAELLHRSPKTLSNLFAAYHLPSPIKVIHERITTEIKHLVVNSKESNKEIAAILGFEDVSSFSRFFKRMTGETLSDYRASNKH